MFFKIAEAEKSNFITLMIYLLFLQKPYKAHFYDVDLEIRNILM